MANVIDLSQFGIPAGSEYHRLIERCPEIACLRFDDEDYLIHEGDMSADIYLVLRGAYVVEQPASDPDNKPGGALAIVVTEDPSSPSFVGEMAYLGGGFRTASVRSSGSTFALRLSPEHLNMVIAEFPLLTQVLCRQFAARLKDADAALKEHQRLLTMKAVQVVKEPGETLCTKGEPAETLYQLINGSLRSEGGSGTRVVGPSGAYLGFIEPRAYFCDEPCSVTLLAETPCLLVGLPKSDRLAVIRNYPELALSCLTGSA